MLKRQTLETDEMPVLLHRMVFTEKRLVQLGDQVLLMVFMARLQVQTRIGLAILMTAMSTLKITSASGRRLQQRS